LSDNKALIVLDMLNDFVTGDLKSAKAKDIVPNIKKLIVAAHRKRVPVIYCNDAHLPIDEEVVERWGKHALKGSKGAQVIPQLKPSVRDYVLEKRTYSGFHETGLDMLLRALYHGEGVTTVVLTGLHTDICVRHTAADGFFRGYKIMVAEDSVQALSQEAHEEGLRYLKDIYNARVVPVDKIISEVG
jgi:nicotinamidase-related amidase